MAPAMMAASNQMWHYGYIPRFTGKVMTPPVAKWDEEDGVGSNGTDYMAMAVSLLNDANFNEMQRINLASLLIAMQYYQDLSASEGISPAALFNAAKKFKNHILEWEQDALDNLKKQS